MSDVAQRIRERRWVDHQLVVGGALLIALLAAGWLAIDAVNRGGFGSTSPSAVLSAEAPPLPVNLQAVHSVTSIDQTRNYTGMIRAQRRSDLAFELTGKVVEVLVDEGDRVAAGDLLARLDTDTLNAQREAVVASLAAAQAQLAELQAGPRIQQINSARADLAAAQSELDSAQRQWERRRTLYERNAISLDEYDRGRFGFQTAQAVYDAAAERLAELEAGTRTEKVAAQQAAVRQLEAAAQEIRVSLEKCELRAPFAAMVTRRNLDPGSIAQPSAPIVRLVEDSRLEAWVGLPVDRAASLSIGQDLPVTVGDREVMGTVKARIEEIDVATRTQTVVLAIDSAGERGVVSGQLCHLELTSRIQTTGIWIPSDALTRGVRGLWSVLAVQPDENGDLRVRKRDIEVLRTDAQRVLVRGTLEDGDRIVADGVHRLTEGQRVVPVESGTLP